MKQKDRYLAGIYVDIQNIVDKQTDIEDWKTEIGDRQKDIETRQKT
jgi:hypothetical protein